MAHTLTFTKGHATGNDFVIVADPDGLRDLPDPLVVALCDRRRGVGGDGLLRVVRTAAHPEVADQAAAAEWFMDYRNADGSRAQMCGNGVRLYARYLVDSGLVTPCGDAGVRVPILTRAGVVIATVKPAAIAVEMPMPTLGGHSTARLSDVEYEGTVATCGNPNLVCRIDDPATVDLTRPPRLDPATFPHGANVEFVAMAPGPPSDALAVRLRVFERGVGETLSCGSGACAVAAVILRESGRDAGTVLVDVPGGQLTVTIDGERCVLAGPAVLVATGEVRLSAIGASVTAPARPGRPPSPMVSGLDAGGNGGGR